MNKPVYRVSMTLEEIELVKRLIDQATPEEHSQGLKVKLAVLITKIYVGSRKENYTVADTSDSPRSKNTVEKVEKSSYSYKLNTGVFKK